MYHYFSKKLADRKWVASWIILILLLIGFGLFVEDIWLNFISMSSSFKIYKNKKNYSVESPAITFCFNPTMKRSFVNQYGLQPVFYSNFLFNEEPEAPLTDILKGSVFTLGQDIDLEMKADFFNDPTNLTVGSNDLAFKVGSGKVEVKELYTALFGLCYLILPQFEMDPNDYLFFSPIFSKKLVAQDRPKYLSVKITSKANAYGLAKNSYVEGDPVIVEIPLQESSQTLISLKPIDTIFLQETSKCSWNLTHYDCLGYAFAHSKIPYTKCKEVCIPLGNNILLIMVKKR